MNIGLLKSEVPFHRFLQQKSALLYLYQMLLSISKITPVKPRVHVKQHTTHQPYIFISANYSPYPNGYQEHQPRHGIKKQILSSFTQTITDQHYNTNKPRVHVKQQVQAILILTSFPNILQQKKKTWRLAVCNLTFVIFVMFPYQI